MGFRLNLFGKTVEFSEKISCNRHESRFKILNIARTDVIINWNYMIIISINGGIFMRLKKVLPLILTLSMSMSTLTVTAMAENENDGFLMGGVQA